MMLISLKVRFWCKHVFARVGQDYVQMSFNKKRNRRESKTAERELSNGGKQKTLHNYSSIMLGTVGGSYTWCSSWKVCNTATICLYISIFSTYIVIFFLTFPRMTSIYSNMYNHKCMVHFAASVCMFCPSLPISVWQHVFHQALHCGYLQLCSVQYSCKSLCIFIIYFSFFWVCHLYIVSCLYLCWTSFFFLLLHRERLRRHSLCGGPVLEPCGNFDKAVLFSFSWTLYLGVY